MQKLLQWQPYRCCVNEGDPLNRSVLNRMCDVILVVYWYDFISLSVWESQWSDKRLSHKQTLVTHRTAKQWGCITFTAARFPKNILFVLWSSKIESSVVKQILSELFVSNFLLRINAHKIWGFSLLYQGNADDCLWSLCNYEALADSTTGMLLSGDQSSTQKSK